MSSQPTPSSEDVSADVERNASSPCPVVESMEQIGSKWRLVVLHDLTEGEKRFNELKRSTDASSRTLSRVLDDLQESALVHRRLEEDAPVATYYSLTEKGEALCPVFSEIENWADSWLDTDA
ncbi:winged helix-turn-helix transcriptional regulator [Salinirubellus salinus]|jgi:DNA-binding HxlR family transcriptional regulator